MKLLLGIVMGAGLVLGGTAYAYENSIPVREFTAAGFKISKFVDPDNGNVCYLVGHPGSYSSGGISCLKN